MINDYWVNSIKFKINGDLILQIDLEFFKYEILINVSDSLMNRFRLIIIESHGLDKLWSKSFSRFASSAFEKLLQTNSCVHIHSNNSAKPFKRQESIIPNTM
jgi:hypothetical protein